ncbi:hypothetical protein [Runella aurantiaca]|uniref:Uncharacterized protein n=1 Tax=Runella aurantiaca TaxID=2282308 RepID=A0A369IG98_9BACT|nr:hypothetical protein [Runella aurantiaca]RDB07800.1 hypothetical protein DVG78_01725 [Runella aurantiaca]
MSDTTQIANTYHHLATISELVNTGILILKRQLFLSQKKGVSKITNEVIEEEEILEAREIILAFLKGLTVKLSSDAEYNKKMENSELKNEILIMQRILENEGILSNEQLSHLDGLLFRIDEERAGLYRKLRNGQY